MPIPYNNKTTSDIFLFNKFQEILTRLSLEKKARILLFGLSIELGFYVIKITSCRPFHPYRPYQACHQRQHLLLVHQ
jgi:hypothetical protein